MFSIPNPTVPKEISNAYEYLYARKILGELKQGIVYSDEPQFYLYSCEYFNNKKSHIKLRGFGSDDNEDVAVTHAIAEAIEYYCITHESGKYIHASYKKLDTKAIDPLRFVPFSQSQLAQNKYKKFIVTHDSELNWLNGYSLTNNKKVLIPASLAYANYNSRQNEEPVIRMPISTGSACGFSQSFALYRGLCEMIERDSYMISFLPEMEKKLVTIDSDDKVFMIKRRIERYGFEVYYINTSLDTSVNTFVCILIDRSGIAPAVCVGLGGDLNPEKAIITASYEAVRRHITNRNSFFRPNRKSAPKKYSFDWVLWRKFQLWSAPHMIREAEEIIRAARSVKFKNLKNKEQISNDKNVDLIVNELRQLNCEVFFVDMRTLEVAQTGLFVTKVLSPEMVPLWRDDRFPYLGVKRLYEVPKKFGANTTSDLSSLEFTKIYPF